MFFSDDGIQSVVRGFICLYQTENYANKIKKVKRRAKVPKHCINRVVKIHNGQKFRNFSITKGILNKPYGSLFNTKKLGSQIHVKKKKKKLLKKKNK